VTTKDTVQNYLSNVRLMRPWDSFIADDVVFTSFISPTSKIEGKTAFIQATRGFYSMIKSLEVRQLVVDGDQACALTRYELQPPNGGAPFVSDVAEHFSVRDGKIVSFSIYFDTQPYPKRPK
jgi:ketosteroid isomerase-like protein